MEPGVPQKTTKEEILYLLREAEQCRDDPYKYNLKFGEIKKKLQNTGEEVASVTHYIVSNDIEADYLEKRFKILYEIGDYENAFKCYQDFSTILPDNPKIFKGLGDCLRKLGKHEDAIKQYDEALNLIGLEDDNPSLQAHVLNNQALSLFELEQFGKCAVALKAAISIESQNALYYVTLGKLYNQVGKEKMALDNFVAASNLLNKPGKHFDSINEKYLEATLPHVIKLMKHREEIEAAQKEESKNAETKIKQEETDAILKKTKEVVHDVVNFNAKRTTTDNIMTKSGDTLTKQMDVFSEVLAQQTQKVEAQTEAQSKLEKKVVFIEISMEELQIRMDKFEEKLNEKLDDFKKKIDSEIKDQALKTKLLEYYKGFTKTFDCICTTSLAIVSGQVLINSGSMMGKVVSTLVSFVDVLSSVVINKLDDIWSSHQINKKATRMTHLGSGNDVGQLIGEAAFKIVLHKEYQKRILAVTDKDLMEQTDKWYKQLFNYLKEVWDKLDINGQRKLYETPAEKLGNKDANLLVKKWLSEEIHNGNGNLSEVFANQIVAQLNC